MIAHMKRLVAVARPWREAVALAGLKRAQAGGDQVPGLGLGAQWEVNRLCIHTYMNYRCIIYAIYVYAHAYIHTYIR